jgi:dihydroorotase
VEEPSTPEALSQILGQVAATDLPLSVHAEDPGHFVMDPPPQDLAEWNRARPPAAEESAVDRLLAAAPPGLRLHVAHVTQAKLARRVREAGHSSEATVHHLLLPARAHPPARGKVNPPLRTEADRLALWDSLREGEVGCVASDHAPHPAASKDLPFERAPSGVPGLETMVPLLLDRVRRGELPLYRLLGAACDRPARWLGQPRGRIQAGHRADLLVVDFHQRRTITSRSLHAPCGWSPYEGWEAIFPVEHYRRGERIVVDGEYVGTPHGELVRPEFARPARVPPP